MNQKHYLTLAEIDKDIDRLIRLSKKWHRKMQMKEDFLQSLIPSAAPEDANLLRRIRDEIEYIEKKIARVENTKLPKLKRTRAAFQTATLPGEVTDEAVVLQKVF